MARSNLNTVDPDAQLEGQERDDAERDAAQRDAWNTTGAALGFLTRNDAIVGANNGSLFLVPAPQDFDLVPADLRPFLCYSIVKHVEYRVAQNASGDLNLAAEDFVIDLPKFKPMRSVDAGEAAFMAAVETNVRSRIVDSNGNHIGDDVKLLDTWLVQSTDGEGNKVLRVVGKGTEGAFKMQRAIDSVAESNRAAKDRVIDQALERGRNKAAAEKTAGPGRGRKAPKVDLGLTI